MTHSLLSDVFIADMFGARSQRTQAVDHVLALRGRNPMASMDTLLGHAGINHIDFGTWNAPGGASDSMAATNKPSSAPTTTGSPSGMGCRAPFQLPKLGRIPMRCVDDTRIVNPSMPSADIWSNRTAQVNSRDQSTSGRVSSKSIRSLRYEGFHGPRIVAGDQSSEHSKASSTQYERINLDFLDIGL
ncbi:hypothetical protein MMC09_006448 [Bachmanniomyces sp. S44760]|nr:hypothetical protein [Bachmanniomyces sp. S44760]